MAGEQSLGHEHPGPAAPALRGLVLGGELGVVHGPQRLGAGPGAVEGGVAGAAEHFAVWTVAVCGGVQGTTGEQRCETFHGQDKDTCRGYHYVTIDSRPGPRDACVKYFEVG